MTHHAAPDVAAPVVVVGGGMAGLTAAVTLHEAGVPVLLLESGDGVGGRVRTDAHPEGFLLDRGFQVILEAYPALQRVVNVSALDAGRFDAGALVWTGKRLIPVADPLRHPEAIARDLSTNLFSFTDKLRLAAFALKAKTASWTSANEAAGDHDRGAESELTGAGFSAKFVDHFARPFWGGITLDRTLSSSRGPLLFTLKMFLEGSALLPAGGVQAVPDQLAQKLPADAIRLNTAVTAIAMEEGKATGVETAQGVLPARAVVIAADPLSAKRLTGIEQIPSDGIGCVTVFLRGRRDPGVGKRLVLDGTGRRAVNHIAPLSSVSPAYAPEGEHLVAAVMLGDSPKGGPFDDRIAQKARDDVAAMLGHAPSEWATLEVVRVPFSQFAQPPGIHARLPKTRTGTTGLYLAGESTVDSSLNGAITSGELAARAIIEDLPRG